MGITNHKIVIARCRPMFLRRNIGRMSPWPRVLNVEKCHMGLAVERFIGTLFCRSHEVGGIRGARSSSPDIRVIRGSSPAQASSRRLTLAVVTPR